MPYACRHGGSSGVYDTAADAGQHPVKDPYANAQPAVGPNDSSYSMAHDRTPSTADPTYLDTKPTPGTPDTATTGSAFPGLGPDGFADDGTDDQPTYLDTAPTSGRGRGRERVRGSGRGRGSRGGGRGSGSKKRAASSKTKKVRPNNHKNKQNKNTSTSERRFGPFLISRISRISRISHACMPTKMCHACLVLPGLAMRIGC